MLDAKGEEDRRNVADESTWTDVFSFHTVHWQCMWRGMTEIIGRVYRSEVLFAYVCKVQRTKRLPDKYYLFVHFVLIEILTIHFSISAVAKVLKRPSELNTIFCSCRQQCNTLH